MRHSYTISDAFERSCAQLNDAEAVSLFKPATERTFERALSEICSYCNV